MLGGNLVPDGSERPTRAIKKVGVGVDVGVGVGGAGFFPLQLLLALSRNWELPDSAATFTSLPAGQIEMRLFRSPFSTSSPCAQGLPAAAPCKHRVLSTMVVLLSVPSPAPVSYPSEGPVDFFSPKYVSIRFTPLPSLSLPQPKPPPSLTWITASAS